MPFSYIGSYERYADIPYAPGQRHSLDVYAPRGAGSRRPVVIFWYGGAWIRGEKDWYRFVGAALANSGYVAVLPDYRLYPQTRFPGFLEDGAQAVRWTREQVVRFGGDSDSIFLMGHSAGAHLAAFLAIDDKYLRAVGGDSRWIRGWISLSAPYTFPDYAVLRQLFPAPSVESDWQLFDEVRGRTPPALLIHGDTDILPADTVAMDRKLRAEGTYVECHIYPGAGHMDTVVALSVPLRFETPALSDVRAFIARTLAHPNIANEPAAGRPCPTLPGARALGRAR